jgi:hypothetical protein
MAARLPNLRTEADMRNIYRFVLTLGAGAALATLPCLAEQERLSKEEREGVQRAIAFQRAKDRADALQARKEARNPEHFTYAQPQNTPPKSLANEQKKDAAEQSDRSADREVQPK